MEVSYGKNDGASLPTPSICLIMKRFGGGERRFELNRPMTRIGRDCGCDLQVMLPGVSREHCSIENDGGELRIRDLSSETGTMLNNASVSEAVLRDGDTIAMGPVMFTVRKLGFSAVLPNDAAVPVTGTFKKERSSDVEAPQSRTGT